jgi:hypothetical protein
MEQQARFRLLAPVCWVERLLADVQPITSIPDAIY